MKRQATLEPAIELPPVDTGRLFDILHGLAMHVALDCLYPNLKSAPFFLANSV